MHVLFTCKPPRENKNKNSVPSEVNSKEEVIAHKGMKVCVVQMRGSVLVFLCAAVYQWRVSHHHQVGTGVKKSL